MRKEKEIKFKRHHSSPRKGTYEVVITKEEWEDHGISKAGYYSLNKRCEGTEGIVTYIWLDDKEIKIINEKLKE